MAKVITGKVRLSYAHLFRPASINGGEEKYSVSLLIPKEDTKTVEKIQAAVEEAVQEGKTTKWGGKVPPNCKRPLRDGDTERPDDEAYAGHYFINANAKLKPGISKPVGRNSDGTTKFQEITDETEVYSGCYARASITLYPFDANGNRGVACGLNNVVKVQDGEPLAGRASLEADFADEDFGDLDLSDEDIPF